MFVSTGCTLIGPDTHLPNFVNLGSQNPTKAVQGCPNTAFPYEFKGSGLRKSCGAHNFFPTRLEQLSWCGFLQRLSRDIVYCPKSCDTEIRYFSLVYRGCFAKPRQILMIFQRFIEESLNIDPTLMKNIEFRCHTISGNKQCPD